jgi:PAS domain S-box-containing protein
VTDDSGAFTYVCPNVHFIFGYTAEEIYDQGTIQALLGDGLVDEEALETQGVLTNIECETTDKTGRTHTLLVNVKEVDIQGGTRLYSCRDITTRKQREDAVRTLHTTTRNLLYAETADEIARTIVEDTPEILDLDASAIYLFREDRSILEPAGYTDAMEAGHGPLQTHRPVDETLLGHSFIENERSFFDDVRTAHRLENDATDLRSAAIIPLGDHGVYVAGSTTPGVFDQLRRELTDLVAATAEAALDRVERERRLREQDHALQRQNEQLTALNEMNELVRGIDRALVRAETREEMNHAVCETLTDADRISFAWIGGIDDVAETVEPLAWAGSEDGYLDSVELSLGGHAAEPATRAGADGATSVVSNVAADLRAAPWRKAAISRGYQSVVSVPLEDEEFTHGVLTVYADAPEAADDLAPVIGELGETVAAAISGLERKDALLSSSVTRLEFETADGNFGLLGLARRADCSLEVSGVVRQTESAVTTLATVEGCDGETLETAATDIGAIDGVHPLSEGVVQLSLSRPFLVLPLADHGAVLQSMDVTTETATLVVDVPKRTDSRQVTQFLQDELDAIDLVAKRTEEQTPSPALYSTFLDRLTDRQLEVARTAYYSGYFESPRTSTGEDLAEALDVSPPAVYRHLRTVQRKLFTTLFDDVGVVADSPV